MLISLNQNRSKCWGKTYELLPIYKILVYKPLCQGRMEWSVQVKLFVDSSSELSFVLSSVSFHATSIGICISATDMLVHFFLNGCFNVFCMTLMTIVKINIKKDIQRSKLRIAMRVLSWIICCLRAAFWNFTEVSASLYSAKYVSH